MKTPILVAAAMLVAACDAPTSPRTSAIARPSAEMLRNDRFERQAIAINDCTGEIIAIDATFHLITSVTYDEAGGYHVKIHRNVTGTAVNLGTGAEYVVSEEDNNQYTVGNGASEQTSIMHFDLVSKGRAPNEVAEANFHITITPDGDVATFHDSFRIDCQS